MIRTLRFAHHQLGAESTHSRGSEPVTVARQQPRRFSLQEVEESREEEKEFVCYVFEFVSIEDSCTCTNHHDSC